MKLEIVTNNTPRSVLYGYDLSDKEAKKFDYLGENLSDGPFFKYKRTLYDLGDFLKVSPDYPAFENWHGYLSDSFFSGIVMKYDENDDTVIVGTYCTKG